MEAKERMEILYEDRDLSVIVKPVGPDSETEVPRALTEQLGGPFFPVHRLDRNVGGVMVYARTKEAAAELSRLVQQGALIKEYYALVSGIPPESGTLEDLLWKDSGKNKVFVVKRERSGVKRAKLEYRRLTAGETSLVRVRLHTGRSHQIRVQFASRGQPLVGERKYSTLNDPCEIALWSCLLRFRHPVTGEELTFTRLPPEEYPWTVV